MKIEDLPVGAHPPAIEYPHFPARHQAFVWRNWELVPVDRLAHVLKTAVENVLSSAAELGLRMPAQTCSHWLTRGYITLIRANWHLLPYTQLLELLDWSPQRLAFHLKEDDFLWVKLGSLKPTAEPVAWRELTNEESLRTSRIRAQMQAHFPMIDRSAESPFQFLEFFGGSRQVTQTALTAEGNTRPAADTVSDNSRTRFRPCYIYSYSALYGDPLLDDSLDPYPDSLLASYAEQGIEGVWLPVVLYQMVEFAPRPSLSEGFAIRLAALRRIVQRAGRFGLNVYVYLNEPRCLPAEVMAQLPDWRGVLSADGMNNALCTSRPAVQRYLRASSETLFRQVPGLAGAFTITMSENLTNCLSRPEGGGQECPLCSKRSPAEVIAQVNRLIAEGVHAASTSATVIVWNWGWKEAWEAEAIDRLPGDVSFMCTSEWGLSTSVGGAQSDLVDYSISQVGPSRRSLAAWERARQRGLKTLAKIQLNTTWECAPIPFLPVPDLVERHLANLTTAGVDGLMLSWTLGGYPGGNLPLLRQSVGEFAEEQFGLQATGGIRQAWSTFSRAFREFPFHVSVLYHSPHNMGPANLLHVEPTGYHATMVGLPYDDLSGWRSVYPADVFEAQWIKLSSGWREGLELLDCVAPRVAVSGRKRFEEIRRMARAAYCHFRSACLQVMFVRHREKRGDGEGRRHLLAILDEEIALAKELHTLIIEDSRIGFEAANHYAYTANDMREKVVSCEYLKARFR